MRFTKKYTLSRLRSHAHRKHLAKPERFLWLDFINSRTPRTPKNPYLVYYGAATVCIVGILTAANWQNLKKRLSREGSDVVRESLGNEELQNRANEFSKTLVERILNDKHLRETVRKMLVEIIANSEDELAKLVVRTLNTKTVMDKVMEISNNVVNNLTRSEKIQADVSNLLVKAINLPYAKESTAYWIGQILSRPDVIQYAISLTNGTVNSEAVHTCATNLGQRVVSEILKDQRTAELGRKYVSEVMVDNIFQDYASKAVWNVAKKAFAPKWMLGKSEGTSMPSSSVSSLDELTQLLTESIEMAEGNDLENLQNLLKIAQKMQESNEKTESLADNGTRSCDSTSLADSSKKRADGPPSDNADAAHSDNAVAAPSDNTDASPCHSADVVPSFSTDAVPSVSADTVPSDSAYAAHSNSDDAIPSDSANAVPYDSADAAPSESADAAPSESADCAPIDNADAAHSNSADAEHSVSADIVPSDDAVPDDSAVSASCDTSDAEPSDTADAEPSDTADAEPSDTADTEPSDTADFTFNNSANFGINDRADTMHSDIVDDSNNSASQGVDAALNDSAEDGASSSVATDQHYDSGTPSVNLISPYREYSSSEMDADNTVTSVEKSCEQSPVSTRSSNNGIIHHM
eukprot:GHVL01035980.1.p1 GENE.GHVL01035980.1~~GHVL01035980.1.p1  ORF type:complete len:637 (+),score=104.65 GHVL01035980.1:1402-3312(+)